MDKGEATPGIGKPRVGLVAEKDLNRHLLVEVLDQAGYQLALSLDSARLATKLERAGEAGLDMHIDAWLLDVDEQEIQHALDLLVENSDAPLLVNDQIPPAQDTEAHQYWRRRLIEKLEVVAVRSESCESSAKDELSSGIDRVWVLAASFGGPEAVKEFIAALPVDLPIALVYGQHIDTNFDKLLISGIGASKRFPVRLLRGRSQLVNGEIAVVPADRQLRFLARGQVVETRRPWVGQYQPALDQVIAELARVYRERLGVIVFSGMCNDGEVGCRVTKACGGTVWVQSPESCMSPDMPHAALRTGSVSFQGTPSELAQALAEHTLGTTAQLPANSCVNANN